MNKLLIISLMLLFCITSRVSFSQLYPVQKTRSDHIVKFGFIDHKGQQIVPFIYDNAGDFLVWFLKKDPFRLKFKIDR